MPVHRSSDERRSLVLDWLASDLTAGEFADQRGVSISSLFRWRRELDGHGDPPRSASWSWSPLRRRRRRRMPSPS